MPLLITRIFCRSRRTFALIGRNGTGEVFPFAALAAGTGRGRIDDGEVWVQPGIRVGYVPARAYFDMAATVFQTVVSGDGETSNLLTEYHEVTHQMGGGRCRSRNADGTKWKRYSMSWMHTAHGLMKQKAEQVINRFELDPDATVGTLSGGQKNGWLCTGFGRYTRSKLL